MILTTTLGPVATSAPANPTGTTNTSGLMMGLAGSITPLITGRVLIIITGNLTNSTAAAGDGAQVRIRYGTGNAPANAGALTGTAVGSAQRSVLERATASDPQTFSCVALVTGLTLSTAVWLDVECAAIVGGTAVLTNVNIVAIEV